MIARRSAGALPFHPAGPLALVAVAAAAVAFVAVRPAPASAQQTPRSGQCVACHLRQPEERLLAPARDFDRDVHAERGLGCLDCHGSASADPGSTATGFIRKPPRASIPALCARCHSDAGLIRGYNPSLRIDQFAEYVSSIHGRRLFERGDTAVAVCVDCHPAHRTLPPSDPASSVFPLNVAETCGRCHADPVRMADHEGGTGQLELWRGSVHGQLMLEKGDVSAPTCNDCHGNHGAAPPGVWSVRRVCGQCHATMAEHFEASGHASLLAGQDLGGCSTCHGHHDIQPPDDRLLLTTSRTVCLRCHDPDEAAASAFPRIALLFDSLEVAAADARHTLGVAADAGMEVRNALFELDDLGTVFMKARSAIHSLAFEPVEKETAAGFTIVERAGARGTAALEEHRFRRVGLAISGILILLLIAGLTLKIRELDHREPVPPAAAPAPEPDPSETVHV